MLYYLQKFDGFSLDLVKRVKINILIFDFDFIFLFDFLLFDFK